MSQITVQVQVSDAFRELGYSDEELRQEVPVLLVLKRFRQGLISSGKAARILGWSRRDFLDLLSREGIPLYDPTEEELAEEWQTAQRFDGTAGPRMTPATCESGVAGRVNRLRIQERIVMRNSSTAGNRPPP